MNHIKSFNEMRKTTNQFVGVILGQKQINYIFDGISKKYLEDFEILIDDGIFYVKYINHLWEFDKIQDLRDFIHFVYYIIKNKPDNVLEIIKRNKNLDYSFYYNWPIRWASYQGHTEVVKLLLQDDRVDPSADNDYAIRWASERGHTEVVKLILQYKRVYPIDKDNLAIKGAIRNGQTEVVKILLQDNRVDPIDNYNWDIYVASKKGHTEVIKLLIQHPKANLTEKQIEEYKKYYHL